MFIMNKKFTRLIEDFVCEHCKNKVKGNGFTNHCSACLYSKHVDNNPGDRTSDCGGLMQPISIQTKGLEYIITHKCLKCGHVKKQKSSPDDNFEEMLKIEKNKAENAIK